jgi:hypothetical protein
MSPAQRGFGHLYFGHLILFRDSDFVLRIYTFYRETPHAPLRGTFSNPRPLGLDSLLSFTHRRGSSVAVLPVECFFLFNWGDAYSLLRATNSLQYREGHEVFSAVTGGRPLFFHDLSVGEAAFSPDLSGENAEGASIPS